MDTQRVNVYRTMGVDSQAVYYIQQYSPEISAWVSVGDSYSDVAHAEVIVNLFNTRQLANKMKEWKL